MVVRSIPASRNQNESVPSTSSKGKPAEKPNTSMRRLAGWRYTLKVASQACRRPAEGGGVGGTWRQCVLLFHKGAFDDEVARGGGVAFFEVARLEHVFEGVQHFGAAAQHDAVHGGIERGQADVLREDAVFDLVRNAALVAERLARDGGVVDQLVFDDLAQDVVLEQVFFQHVA